MINSILHVALGLSLMLFFNAFSPNLYAHASGEADYTRVAEESIRLYKASQLDAAIEAMQKAVAIAPLTLQATAHNNLAALYMKQAQQAQEAGQNARALTAIRLARYWMEPGWPALQPKTEVQNINTRKARDSYTALYKASGASHDAPSHLKLGKALQAGGQLKQAALEYSEALNLDAKLQAARSALGDIYMALDAPTKALTQYEAAYNAAPKAETLIALAQAYFKTGSEEQALQLVQSHLTQHPKDAQTLRFLKQFWHSMQEENPRSPKVLFHLGNAYYQNGERSQAQRYYLEAEALIDEVSAKQRADMAMFRVALRTQLAQLLIDEGRVRDALPLLMDVVKAAPKLPQAVGQLWRGFSMVDEAAEAEPFVHAFIKQPMLPQAHADYMAQMVLDTLPTQTQKAETLSRWAGLHPYNPTWQAAASRALLVNNTPQAALAPALQWQALQPKDPEPLAQLVSIYGRLNETQKQQAAQAQLNTLQRLANNTVNFSPKAEQSARAQAMPIEKAVEAAPYADALESAFQALQAGQFQRALGQAKLALVHGKERALAYYYIGLSNEGLKQPKAAETAYRESLKQPDAIPEARYALGVLLLKQQRGDEARAALRTFLNEMAEKPAAEQQRLSAQVAYSQKILQ